MASQLHGWGRFPFIELDGTSLQDVVSLEVVLATHAGRSLVVSDHFSMHPSSSFCISLTEIDDAISGRSSPLGNS